jgi:hypothetical protein
LIFGKLGESFWRKPSQEAGDLLTNRGSEIAVTWSRRPVPLFEIRRGIVETCVHGRPIDRDLKSSRQFHALDGPATLGIHLSWYVPP